MLGPYNYSYQSPEGYSPYGPGYRYSGCKKVFRTWWRQPKPRLDPLPFSYFLAEVTQGYEVTVDSLGGRVDHSVAVDANNACYSRFIGKLHAEGSSQLAVTLAEHRQAISMVERRAKQLLMFTIAVKRGRLKDAAHLVGIPPDEYVKTIRAKGSVKKAKEYMKVPANAWLEWHFGLDPLIKDLESAVHILSKGPVPVRIRASATAYKRGNWSQGPVWGWYESINFSTLAKVQMGCQVQVSNPNLAMANELGFVNLANVALELTPWSFVVGWFVNYQEVLSSYTDLLGYEISRAYTTTSVATTENYSKVYVWRPPQDGKFGSGRTLRINRTMGIASPRLTLRFNQVSVTRGATAIALLLQQL